MSDDENNEIEQPNSGENNESHDEDDEYELSADGSVFSVSLSNSQHFAMLALIGYGMTLLAIVLVRLFSVSDSRKGGKR